MIKHSRHTSHMRTAVLAVQNSSLVGDDHILAHMQQYGALIASGSASAILGSVQSGERSHWDSSVRL